MDLEALKTSNPDAYKYISEKEAELKALKEATPPKPDPDDPDLRKRAADEREAKDKEALRNKQMETAIAFQYRSKDFLKENESLLPKEAADIFNQAEKEKFNDAVEKDQAIKSGLVQAYFTVQAHVDELTPGQKSMLDDYLKLTKTDKQAKAQSIYEMVFEPAFEALKKMKKAQALNHSGGVNTDGQPEWQKKMIARSSKRFLGEKHGS